MSGTIIKVSGPLVVAEGLSDANVSDVVRVGSQRLIGEILNMSGDKASIQVYEETSGLGPGAVVETTGMPMSVELGPGMLENIYDGIQRPLPEIRERVGSTISRGVDVPALNREKKWEFTPVAKVGDKLSGGDVLGTVQETSAILHKIMVPPTMSGTVVSIEAGTFTVTETVAVLEDGNKVRHELSMMQKWPVRINRPYAKKFMPSRPMNSGQRIIDTLFPIAKGGTAAVPGPFGSGKTVVQHQLAKWSDVDIVVYIGCGERGNEMTDVLMEFPELTDPRQRRLSLPEALPHGGYKALAELHRREPEEQAGDAHRHAVPALRGEPCAHNSARRNGDAAPTAGDRRRGVHRREGLQGEGQARHYVRRARREGRA